MKIKRAELLVRIEAVGLQEWSNSIDGEQPTIKLKNAEWTDRALHAILTT